MHEKKNYQLNLMRIYKKKQMLIIMGLLLCAISFITIFGRYVTNSINNFFIRSKEFYFFSDKLTEDGSVFQIENWSGVDDYTIIVNMNSRKNNIQVASYDIGYNIKYTCSDNAICQLSKDNGIISKETNTDFFNLIITPNAQLETGDKVTVGIEVTTNTNYEKKLKGKFTLVVGQENLTYEITDEPDKPYMELSVTNTLPYYIVEESFANYSPGNKIDIDTYLLLSEENKTKCYSSIVTVDFDPNEILLDVTSQAYQSATNITTTRINGKNYMNSITLPIDAISSIDLRFYKVDSSQDYSYPNENNYSIVTVTTK